MPAGVGDKATRGLTWAEEEGRPQQAVYCRAEDEIWCEGEEGLVLVFSFPVSLVFLFGWIDPRSAAGVGGWEAGRKCGEGRLEENVFVICWGWGERGRRNLSRFLATDLGMRLGGLDPKKQKKGMWICCQQTQLLWQE